MIVPVFNEQDVADSILGELEQNLLKTTLNYEIIVVNDGSTDGTSDVLRNSSVKISLLEHPCNLGYGAALKTGIKNARYELIGIIDGDGTYPTQEIPGLVARMKDCEMAIGARVGKDAAIPLLRRPVKWVLTLLAGYLVRQRIPDLNSGLRIMKKELIDAYFHLLPNNFSFTATITLAALVNGHKVKFHPIQYHPRHGVSKFRPVRDTLEFLQVIIKTATYFDPLRTFMPLAISFFLLSLGVLLSTYFFLEQVADITSIILFVTGIHLLAIGVIADLIVTRGKGRDKGFKF
jgi:glycosyltransferase involved in cell wall biosynthesis